MDLVANPPRPIPQGLITAIEAAGYPVDIDVDGWRVRDAKAVQAIIDAYDPLPFITALKLDEAAATRWAAMTGGMTTQAGIPLATDPVSLSLITSLYAAAASGLPGPFTFKDRAGKTQSVTPQQAIDLFKDAAGFVQSCYDREGALIAEVKAAPDATATLAIDAAAGFPANS